MDPAQSDNLSFSDAFRGAGPGGRGALILSSWFGSGLFPVASGTFGTLTAIPLVLISGLGTAWAVSILIAVTGVGIWAAGRTEDLLRKEDPSEVVIDEVAGLSVTMFLLPLSWQSIALGFFLFRFFDVAKPWPVHPLEKLKGGWGIVMDDLMAGVYAHVLLRAVLFLIM